MHQAEQLSKPSHLTAPLLSLPRRPTNNRPKLKRSMTPRVPFILNLSGAAAVNSLFAQLAQHIETEQLFALNQAGYCIASSRAEQQDGCIG